MKSRDVLLLGGAAVAAYFLFLKPKDTAGAEGGGGGAGMPQLPFLPGVPGFDLNALFNSLLGMIKPSEMPVVSVPSVGAFEQARILGNYLRAPEIAITAASPQNISTTISQAAVGSYAIGSAPGGGLVYGNLTNSNIPVVVTGTAVRPVPQPASVAPRASIPPIMASSPQVTSRVVSVAGVPTTIYTNQVTGHTGYSYAAAVRR